MHHPSPEDGVNAATPLHPIDPARFPFVLGVETILRTRSIPLARISGPDAHRPAVYRIDSSLAEWECLVIVHEDHECVAFRSLLPLDVPTGRLHEVAALVARVNASRIVGHFAIDHACGRITHTNGVQLAGLEPSAEALVWMLGENLLAVDLHMAAFMLVAWTDLVPEVALRECGPGELEAA